MGWDRITESTLVRNRPNARYEIEIFRIRACAVRRAVLVEIGQIAILFGVRAPESLNIEPKRDILI